MYNMHTHPDTYVCALIVWLTMCWWACEIKLATTTATAHATPAVAPSNTHPQQSVANVPIPMNNFLQDYQMDDGSGVLESGGRNLKANTWTWQWLPEITSNSLQPRRHKSCTYTIGRTSFVNRPSGRVLYILYCLKLAKGRPGLVAFSICYIGVFEAQINIMAIVREQCPTEQWQAQKW